MLCRIKCKNSVITADISEIIAIEIPDDEDEDAAVIFRGCIQKPLRIPKESAIELLDLWEEFHDTPEEEIDDYDPGSGLTREEHGAFTSGGATLYQWRE